MKARPTPASLASIGQVTKHTTVKSSVIPSRSKAENANNDVIKGFA